MMVHHHQQHQQQYYHCLFSTTSSFKIEWKLCLLFLVLFLISQTLRRIHESLLLEITTTTTTTTGTTTGTTTAILRSSQELPTTSITNNNNKKLFNNMVIKNHSSWTNKRKSEEEGIFDPAVYRHFMTEQQQQFYDSREVEGTTGASSSEDESVSASGSSSSSSSVDDDNDSNNSMIVDDDPDMLVGEVVSVDDESINQHHPGFLNIPVEEWGRFEEKQFLKWHTEGYPSWWEEKARKSKKQHSCPHELISEEIRNERNITLYQPTYMDRSGSVIRRLIDTYAYAEKYNFIFGGSIDRYEVDIDWSRKRSVHEEYINILGLSDVLKFATPHNNGKDPDELNIHHSLCVHGIDLSTSFLNMLRSKQNPKPTKQQQQQQRSMVNNDKQTVAVHIRRGDAQPCTGKIYKERYHPNIYFIQIIQQYTMNHDANVTIYSQTESFESFDDFRQQGYNVVLDGSVSDAWNALMTSDIAIISPGSEFSTVPALLNPNIVYSDITQYNFRGVHHDIIRTSQNTLRNMINERCYHFIQQHPQTKKKHTLW